MTFVLNFHWTSSILIGELFDVSSPRSIFIRWNHRYDETNCHQIRWVYPFLSSPCDLIHIVSLVPDCRSAYSIDSKFVGIGITLHIFINTGMSNQLFAAKSAQTRKKRNATKAMAAAFFCVSSSLTAQGARAFSTTANAGVSAFVRSGNKARTGSPATRTSLAFGVDNKFRSGVVTNNSLWRTTSSLPSASTAEETVSEASCAYDLENKEKGLGNYVPTEFENSIYQWWESAGCFEPDAKQTKEESDANERQPYVLPMPPPNVTGRLHMGHAIFVALQDVLARFHRMRGRPVLWLPGAYEFCRNRFVGKISWLSFAAIFNL